MKRPSSSYVIAITALLLAALASIQSLFYSTQEAGLQGFAIILLLTGIVFTYYVFPSIDLDDQRVVINNPFVRHEIGLGAIEAVDTRFALKVSGDFGTISAWAAPAPSRLRHRSHTREDFRTLGLKEGQEVRPSDLPSTISGSYALQIRRAIEKGGQPSYHRRRVNLLGVLSIALPAVGVLVSQL
ncbi:MAG: hypothetical protein EBS38_02420 [Actinobacteria bacterium]|nr:hypothetical protein [Actinomycetota bacterium]